MDVTLNEEQIDKVCKGIIRQWERDALPHAINEAVERRILKRTEDSDELDDIADRIFAGLKEQRDAIVESFTTKLAEAMGNSVAVIASQIGVEILERLMKDGVIKKPVRKRGR